MKKGHRSGPDQLRGVNQIQIVPPIGLTFSTALRHMLRHDPDVMMVGEVRDFETAEIAIRSGETGRTKILALSGDSSLLMKELDALSG